MADFILDIDTKFIDRLEKAEKALEKLVDSTNEVTNSFEKLTTGGLSQFSTAIDKIVNKIDSLSSAKIGDFGVTDTANKVVSAVDNIDKAYETVRKIKEESAAQNSDIPREEYVIVDTKKLEKEAEALENTIKRVERSRNYYQDKHQKLVDANSAPSKIRDAEVQLETKTEELSRLGGELSKVKENIAKAQASNKEAVSNMLTNTVDGFMPIASLKSYINEINTLLHEVPSLYPDPSEQQKVVDQLISLRKRYTDAMKSSEQKAQEYAKAKRDNAIDLAREYETAKNGYDKLEKLEESHYEQMRSWREKNVSEQSREDLYADEIKAYEEQIKARAKADEDFARKEDARIKERDAALDAAAKAADKRDEEILKENEAFVEKIRAKYADLIRETRQVSQELTRIEGLEQKYGDDIDVSNQKNEYIARLAQLNQERLEIERDHQDKISSIQAGETKRRMRDEVDAAERAARQVIEARKKAEKDEEKHRGTYQGAMEYSKNTKSIQEQTQAIKYLKQARESLKRTDFSSEKEYRKALNNLTLEIDRQTDSIKELNLESKKTEAISGQLKTAITNMVGIGAIKGYVNQLVRIRGEFELQHKSLQVLLRNKDEANKLWEQTIDMAVKSPYRVDQLVTATKQLAAYRVETEKLHSTTRMLADLSSGLGVEINRLILAFGQVKAANFLRGTELRQFSEAGINILDELAEHYSILEGRIVSVGDVFDRVSKRMVSFADVETVLQKMTGEGGQFYKMQEQQAETLRGMTMNLKDSIMLMYNDIGEASDGILKKTLTFFKYMVDNWKSYANIITTVVGALAGYKTAMLTISILTSRFNPLAYLAAAAFVKMGSTATWATARIRTLNRVINAIKLHPIMAIIAAIPVLIGAIVGLNSSFDKNADSIKSHSHILEENTMAAKKAASGIKELTEERSNLLKIGNRSAEQEKRLNDITSARTRLLGELAVANEEYAKSLKLAGDDSEKMAKAIEEQNNKLDAQLVLAYKMSNIDWGDRAKVKNTETTKVATSSVFEGIYDGNLDLGAILTDSPAAIIENAINNSGGDIEKAISSMFSNLTGYTRAEQIKMIKRVLEDTSYGDIISDYIDAENFLDETFSSLEGDVTDVVTAFVNTTRGQILKESLNSVNEGVKNGALLELQNYFKKEFVSQAIPDSVQEEFKKVIAKSFGLEDDWFTKQISKELSPWQKGYNTILEDFIKNKGLVGLSPVTATTSIEDALEDVRGFIKANKAIVAQFEQQKLFPDILKQYTKEQADQAEKFVEYGKFLEKMLGAPNKGGKTDTRYTNLIKTVNDVYSAFDKLEEKFGDTIATEKLWRDYSESIDTAFRRVGKSAEWVREQFGDLNSKDSLKSALNWIAENASTPEARLQAKTASAKISVDIEIENRDKAFNELTRNVEDMFAGYELSIELDKLHVPKEFAKDFFNIDTIDITELRKQLSELKTQFEDKGAEDEYQAYLKKLDELEAKSQQERLKKYVEYSKTIVGDRAKILLDSFYELEDIGKTFVMTNSLALNKNLIDNKTKMAMEEQGMNMSDLLSMSDTDLASTWDFTQDQIDKIREFNKELEAQRDLAIEASNRKTQADLDSMDWKVLKESDTFTLAMQDLERVSDKALEKLISQITLYKSEWADMPYTEVNEMIEYLNKLEDARLAYYKPDEAIEVARKEMESLGFTGTDDAQTKMLNAETRIIELKEELSIVEEMERLKSEGATHEVLIAELRSRGITDEAEIARISNMTTDELRAQSTSLNGQIKDEQTITSDAAKFLELQTKIIQKYKEKEQRVRDMKKCVDNVFDGWDAINELFKDGSMSSEIAGFSRGVSDSVLEALALVQGFKAAKEGIKAGGTEAEIFGYKLNMAMGIIGWIVMAIQLIAKGLKFAFEQHDKDIQGQIDGETKKVEALKKAYDSLEKKLEEAYRSADIGKYTKAMNQNLEQQIKHTENMIELEKDKKDPDEEKIKAWEEEIEDMEAQMAENINDTFNTLTDGILENTLSAARDFVDAWYDAFQETGDGMQGLQDSFKEMFSNMLKQQASMNIVGPFLDRFKKQLEQYISIDDTVLDAGEARSLRDTWDAIAPKINESLENYFSMFEDVLNTDYGELSGLEKGIQGMTEEQAEVLAAYWNSCRFILSNIDMSLSSLADRIMNSPNTQNAIVEALNTQIGILRSIDSRLGSVIESGYSEHNGSYIKVLM